MHVLIGIALKSLFIAALTLGLLQLMRKRSAAERSWLAHIGLLALVIMAIAPLALPSWNIEAPFLLGSADASVVQSAIAAPVAIKTAPQAALASPVVTKAPQTKATLNPLAVTTALYAVPAAILLFVTFLALARLLALRARAEVLVDGHWLSALARAQRRMGFKHGTALLTSNDLASPISWGLMRPVILLNSRAVEATGEAEAIIAHELAHVARMDWAKLLLARIATALFWFNPLVWVLAREAHQLREEAADDSVLAADIQDTDYAQLLVGVARHECPGLLLGAHGVAPSKSSLARRVARVLDATSVRGPVAGSFAFGMFAGAVLVAAPLAALTFTPAKPKTIPGSTVAASEPSSAYQATRDEPTDLPHIIANGVSASVTTAVAAVAPSVRVAANGQDFEATSSHGAIVRRANGVIVERSPNGAVVTMYPPDAHGRRKVLVRSSSGATAVAYADTNGEIPYMEEARARDRSIDRAVEAKVAGITPEYIAAMRAAAPRLRSLGIDEFSGLRALGATPEYARSLAAEFPSIGADELMEARSVGLTGEYVNAMRAAGIQGGLNDFIELRSVGIDPAFAARVKASGIKVTRADDLVELRALGVSRAPARPQPPPPPHRPHWGLPAAAPPNWNPPQPSG